MAAERVILVTTANCAPCVAAKDDFINYSIPPNSPSINVFLHLVDVADNVDQIHGGTNFLDNYVAPSFIQAFPHYIIADINDNIIAEHSGALLDFELYNWICAHGGCPAGSPDGTGSGTNSGSGSGSGTSSGTPSGTGSTPSNSNSGSGSSSTDGSEIAQFFAPWKNFIQQIIDFFKTPDGKFILYAIIALVVLFVLLLIRKIVK